MADLNEVRLIGRLTRDPETRMTPSGTQVGSMGVAVNRRYKDATGTMKEETTFVDITCWGKTAELAAQYLRKGRQVFIAGRLKLDTWDDKQTGHKRSKLSVVAENIQFLDGGQGNSGKNGGEQYQQQPANNRQYQHAARSEKVASPYSPPPEWDEPPMEEPPF